MEVDMDRMSGRIGWVLFLGAVLLAIAAGVIGYNAGLANAVVAQAAPGAVPPWGFGWRIGWGFGPLFLVLLFFWLFFARAFCWRGPWRRYGYYEPQYDLPHAFDEWHRRAHDRMKENGPADDPGRRG
jgi:hypothetical protein